MCGTSMLLLVGLVVAVIVIMKNRDCAEKKKEVKSNLSLMSQQEAMEGAKERVQGLKKFADSQSIIEAYNSGKIDKEEFKREMGMVSRYGALRNAIDEKWESQWRSNTSWGEKLQEEEEEEIQQKLRSNMEQDPHCWWNGVNVCDKQTPSRAILISQTNPRTEFGHN